MIATSSTYTSGLTWWHIIRLGLIQTSLGGIVVLTTSTLNRIMVVELALAATLPGFLVTIHHIVQLARPRIGYGSDIGGRRTPWIIGGMFILAIGGVGAAFGTTLIPQNHWLGVGISALGFFAIGVGTGATGTSLLALLAKHVASERKPAAAALVWFMMIIGFAVTAGVAGHFLDPYSPERLLVVTSTVSLLAVLITLAVIRGIEPAPAPSASPPRNPGLPFRSYKCCYGPLRHYFWRALSRPYLVDPVAVVRVPDPRPCGVAARAQSTNTSSACPANEHGQRQDSRQRTRQLRKTDTRVHGAHSLQRRTRPRRNRPSRRNRSRRLRWHQFSGIPGPGPDRR